MEQYPLQKLTSLIPKNREQESFIFADQIELVPGTVYEIQLAINILSFLIGAAVVHWLTRATAGPGGLGLHFSRRRA